MIQESTDAYAAAALRCAQEPIHIPGAVQPHGALLALDERVGRITHASANLMQVLGREAAQVLGLPLDRVLDPATCAALLPEGRLDETVDRAAATVGAAGRLHLRAYRSGPRVCIDIESMPASLGPQIPILAAQATIETFRHATTGLELCELAVRGLRGITGYDRVMAYRFGDDGHGEVIAEVRAPHLDAYLGLRYPASDIPAQARRHYLRQRVGLIADSAYVPVPLLAAAPCDASPLDLTRSALRSVSPVHCEYMRNMGTAASLTIGLADGARLWGMLVCHHAVPRVAGPEMRAAAGLVGEVVSVLLESLAEAEIQAQRQARESILQGLVAQLARPAPIADALEAAEEPLLAIVAAAGALVRLDGRRFLIGRTPPLADAERALATMLAQSADRPLALDDLTLRFPELAACQAEGSGALSLPLGTGSDEAILWFRPELSRTVHWGGDPSRHGTAHPVSGRLSPRTSFAAWQQIVQSHSVAWSPADLALVGAVREAVQSAIAERTRVALRHSEERFQLLAEHSGVVVTLNDMDDIRRYVSPAAERILGWRPEDLVGRSTLELVHPDDRQALVDGHAALRQGAGVRTDCYRSLQPDGSWLWIEGHARLRPGADGAAPTDYVVVLRDATERKEAEQKLQEVLERLKRMASIDGLTGIANRRHFDEVAEREWRRCERDGLPLSLLLLDADHFKRFNDRHGHLAGDACLRAIAATLDALAQRPGDLAARYGGEEFLLLLPHTALDGAVRVAERIRRRIEALPIAPETRGDAASVTVSIGVATAWPGRADDAAANVQGLLARSDAALYRAKGGGRNRVVPAHDDDGRGAAQADVAAEATAAEAGTAGAAERPGPPGTTHAAAPAAALPLESDGAHEALIQFLYRAPIGLVQTTRDGTIEMINPMSASLLLPLSNNGDLDNLFVTLGDAVPDLRQWVEAYRPPSGPVCEAVRFWLPADAAEEDARQWLSISLTRLDEARLMAMISDVTLEVQRERSGLALRLDAAARTDSLTQLPNRTAVRDLLERTIARSKLDPEHEFAVLFMNCDRFKQINDTLGHAAGDVVLGLMADRLQTTLRQRTWGRGNAHDETMVGRLGGDEFVVLLDDLRSPDETPQIAQRLLEVLSQPYGVLSRQLRFSVSMGVVRRAEATVDADAVLQDASIAMVEAKRGGGARYRVFEPLMHERVLRRGGIESDLRRALVENELYVVYQPVVALQDDADTDAAPARSAGVEALVRWRHPTRGIVPPIEFIGVAEQCGLIRPLGEFVLATACRQFVEWRRGLGVLAPRLLAVNLSRGQLAEPGFVDYVCQVLDESGMDPRCLQLEVTESLAAQDQSIQARLHDLKKLGLTLALDDFGTGYSSLASLHELPVDTVKIDRSFVSEASSSTYHRVLIEATVRVANSLDMSTVAEGIETDDQAALLRRLGCEKGQGYLFGKPMAAAELARWLQPQIA